MNLKASNADDAAIDRMLRGKRIAIVGLSDDPSRPSHHVAAYLIDAGYEVIPVNPNCPSVHGIPSRASLREIEGPIDFVDVFRRAEACEEIVREAVQAGAKGVWLQSGIRNDQASALAREAGIDFVQDRCVMVEHARRRPL